MADWYWFDIGDGADMLVEQTARRPPLSQQDVLEFGAGIAPGNVFVARNGTNLVLSLSNGTDSVTIGNWYSTQYGGSQIEQVRFSDGTVWSAASLTQFGLSQSAFISMENNDSAGVPWISTGEPSELEPESLLWTTATNKMVETAQTRDEILSTWGGAIDLIADYWRFESSGFLA